MRPDQIARLAGLSEELADVMFDEATPSHWPAHGIPLSEMTTEDRGNRYWCKKNAAATMSLLVRVETLRIDTMSNGGQGRYENGMLDDEIKKAEKEASKLVDELMTGKGKANFNKRVYGKK